MRLRPDRTRQENQPAAKAGRRHRLVALAAAAATLVLITTPLAQAQERRTLIDMLFGRRAPAPEWGAYPPPPPPARRAPQRPKASTTPARTASEASSPAPEPVEKSADARKIVVIGDFLASGLADGLTEAFAATPGIVIVGRPNGSSGLVREDYYDWQQELPKLLDETKPAALAVMIGANDRQQMELAGNGRFGSEEWMAEYGRRASALALAAGVRKVPLIWVGLPPFQSPSMTADAVTINRLLRAAVEKSGGTFIDIWDGFADEAGKFVTTGSDINGKPVRLRGTDGIGISKAGKRKLAFYLEKPLNGLFGDSIETLAPDEPKLGAENLPDLLRLSPSGEVLPMTTPPLAITDPALDGGEELLGAKVVPARHTLSPRQKLVERGELPPAPPGRADSDRFQPKMP